MSIVLLREYFDTSIIDFMFFIKIISMVVLTWFPVHFLYLIVEFLDPSEHKKIMRD